MQGIYGKYTFFPIPKDMYIVTNVCVCVYHVSDVLYCRMAKGARASIISVWVSLFWQGHQSSYPQRLGLLSFPSPRCQTAQVRSRGHVRPSIQLPATHGHVISPRPRHETAEVKREGHPGNLASCILLLPSGQEVGP